jgi:hypothetical protein
LTATYAGELSQYCCLKNQMSVRFYFHILSRFLFRIHFGWEKWWTGRLIWWGQDRDRFLVQAEIKVNFSEFIFIFDFVFAFYYSEQKSRQNMEIKSYFLIKLYYYCCITFTVVMKCFQNNEFSIVQFDCYLRGRTVPILLS